MKKITPAIKFHLLAFLFLIPALASAAKFEFGVNNPLNSNTFEDLIGNIADFLLNVGAAIAVVMIIYGGFQYTTSRGDENKTKEAHTTLTYAIVGLTIIIIGKGFIYVIQDILGSK